MLFLVNSKTEFRKRQSNFSIVFFVSCEDKYCYSEVSGKQNSLFPLGPVIKCLLLFDACFLPFHWPRVHHVTRKQPTNNGLLMRNTVQTCFPANNILRDSRTSRHSAHTQGQVQQSHWVRIRNDYSAHTRKIGPSQRSRFLELTKSSAASRDENGKIADRFMSCQRKIFKNMKTNLVIGG